MSKNQKNWWISMKIANFDREILYIFWTTWGISMKLSGKMWLMIILIVTKNLFSPNSKISKYLLFRSKYLLNYYYYYYWLLISISNSRCEKPTFSKFLIQNTKYFGRKIRFLIEILGTLIKILGFSFEIVGILEICDKRIPWT